MDEATKAKNQFFKVTEELPSEVGARVRRAFADYLDALHLEMHDHTTTLGVMAVYVGAAKTLEEAQALVAEYARTTRGSMAAELSLAQIRKLFPAPRAYIQNAESREATGG